MLPTLTGRVPDDRRVAVAVAGDVVQQFARHLRRPRRVEPVEGRDHRALDGALLRREDLEHARAQARAHGLVVGRADGLAADVLDELQPFLKMLLDGARKHMEHHKALEAAPLT